MKGAVAARRFSTAAAVSTALLLAPLSAQEQSAPRVSLGFAAGPPGRQVTIPLLLENATGRQVGQVVSEVRFPAARLAFIRVERAALLAADRFEAEGKIREEPQKQDTKVLDIRIASQDGRTALQDGILAYLIFRIEPEVSAQKTPEILLRHEAKIFSGLTEAASPLAVISEEVKLVVENPDLPVFACVFYMH